MADPLSAVGSVAGLLSLGIQVTQSLFDFYNSYKTLDSDLVGITQRLECLLEILYSLEKAISVSHVPSSLHSLHDFEGSGYTSSQHPC